MDNEFLTADEETPQPPRKGMSFCKMTMLSVLAMAVVFLVWLFYPVRPGTQALRAFLPDECVALGEVHSPAAVNSGLLARKFWAGFRELPAYPLLARLTRARGIDLDAAGRDFEEQMRALENAVCGLRNCAAVAFGVTADPEPQLAVIFALDNLGLTLVKSCSMFLPRPDKSCVLVSIPATLTEGEKIPDFYLAGVPGTRYFLLTTKRELLPRFRINSPRPTRTRYAAGRQETVEFSANLGTESLAAVSGVNLPGFAGGRADGWWEYADFGMEARLRLPALDKPSPDPARRQLLTLPGTEPGVTLSLAAAPESLRAEELTAELAKTDFPAAVRKKLSEGLQTLLAEAAGSYCLRLDMAQGHPGMALHWLVRDPARAQKGALAGMRKIFEAACQQSNAGVFGFLPPSALLQVRETPGRATLTAPLLPPLEMAFAAGNSSRPAVAALGVGTVASEKLQVQACGPQTRGIMRLQWRYARELLDAWHKGVAGMLGTAKSVQKMFDIKCDIPKMETAINDAMAVLASFDYLTAEVRNETDVAHNQSEIVVELNGKLRLPQNADGR